MQHPARSALRTQISFDIKKILDLVGYAEKLNAEILPTFFLDLTISVEFDPVIPRISCIQYKM